MKTIFYLVLTYLLSTLSSCSCNECFNLSEPLRIIYLDSDGNNLIENQAINPKSAYFCSNALEVSFGLKDYVVNGSKEYYHLEFDNELLQSECENSECCIIIEFESGDTDTLIYQIRKEDEDCCTSFPVSKFEYNNKSSLGKSENTIGAYVITK